MSEEVEILLVEDNPSDIELTLRALRKHNLVNQVHVVEDGAEALDYLFHHGRYSNGTGLPRVVFLDLKLPKVSGLEVLRELKGHPETSTIPVVVLTSSHEERDLVESYELGVNSYVVKPVDFQQFITAVSEIGFYWLLINRTPAVEGQQHRLAG